MDLGEQPLVFPVLTQVEEIVIAWVVPILQVTHARGGKYKYSGHTISFPQDINSIAKILPHQIEVLDILIVKREGYQCKHCHLLFVDHVWWMNCITKLEWTNIYRDVDIDLESVVCLLNNTIDVSARLCYINYDIDDSEENYDVIYRFGIHQLGTHPSPFTSRMPNAQREI